MIKRINSKYQNEIDMNINMCLSEKKNKKINKYKLKLSLNDDNEDPRICPLCSYMKQFNKTTQHPKSIDTRPYIITVLDLTFRMFSIYKIYNILKGDYYRYG